MFEPKSISSKITNIQFRDKTTGGWNRYHVKMQFNNNETFDVVHGREMYMKALLNNIVLRDSCTNCKFKNILCFLDVNL